jgi:hypothetical protein
MANKIVLKTSFLILNIHIINPGLCYNWYKQCSYAEPGILTSFIVDVCMFNVLMCEVIVRFVDICRIAGHQFIIMEAILLGWTLEKIKTFTVQLHCQSSSCWPRFNDSANYNMLGWYCEVWWYYSEAFHNLVQAVRLLLGWLCANLSS